MPPDILLRLGRDPLEFGKCFWPQVEFYGKQREIIYSVRDNVRTVVPAGNELGKDFVAGFIVVWFFMTRRPCRVVTTSAGDDHLDVLWGEIHRFVENSAIPLTVDRGGPLIVLQRDIRWAPDGKECPTSYIKSLVASQQNIAKMQGHHANPMGLEDASDGVPRSMFVADESSSVVDSYHTMAQTWAKRMFEFGNTWPCENFFRYAVEGRPGTEDRGGDIPRAGGQGYLRKVIRIVAEDSPNVRLALAQQRRGQVPTGELLVPGVKSWETYQRNLVELDEVEKQVSLWAQWPKGADTLMYPAEWLDQAHRVADGLVGRPRQARSMGVDTAEGKDSTVWCVCDELGVVHLLSMKTPDTSVIVPKTIELLEKYDVPPERVMFDRGGGGYEHVCELKRRGYQRIRSIGFGEVVALAPKRGLRQLKDKVEIREEKYAYKNRRAEMYDVLRQLLNPKGPDGTANQGFGLPREYHELRRQLAPVPRWRDGEGRLYLPPKRLEDGVKDDPNNKNKLTIKKLIGCSPDESDALVLAVYGMTSKTGVVVAGAA